jgi:inner membrane protein
MKTNSEEKFTQSLTFRAIIIAFLTLMLLIPSIMIQNLISERQQTSIETIRKINDKWSSPQTLTGPILNIPYTTETTEGNKVKVKRHVLRITPDKLKITTKLFPEERHYGIYKSILYKSDIHFSGNFSFPKELDTKGMALDVGNAYIYLELTDLRGIGENKEFVLGGTKYTARASSKSQQEDGLQIDLTGLLNTAFDKPLAFDYQLKLKGSSDINFVPVGKSTTVEVAGAWQSPGFTGNFTPEYKIDQNGFKASWNVLSFNRPIPEYWSDNEFSNPDQSSFGVDLVDTVDQYQQNMRSAKYAIMFILLTFVVFFFIEILTGKRIHPIQYLLVGIALIIFYTLLLSISEQINFGAAYLIASTATIGLITVYVQSIFKDKRQSLSLCAMLCGLYTFLYVILQLEDIALLIGSLGLFCILAIIMYFSRKIEWYKPKSQTVEE